jgi:hypothetical protein
MQEYIYKTKISNEGIIYLPNEKALFGKQVKIIIDPIEKKEPIDENKKYLVENFLKEWTGLLKNVDFDKIDDSDDTKFQYLKEKYLCEK